MSSLIREITFGLKRPAGSCLTVACMAVFLFQNTLVLAENTPEREKQLEDIRSQIKNTRQVISRAEGEKTGIQADLKRAEKKISYIGRRLHLIKKDFDIQQKRYQLLQKEVVERERVLRQEQQRLAGLMRSAFQLDRHGELRMLLSQESPALFMRMLTYHEYFNRQRMRQIEAVNQRLSALNTAQHALYLQTRALSRLQNRRQVELVNLESVKEQRQQTLAIINQDINREGKRLSQLRKDEQALGRILKSLADLLSDIPAAGRQQKRFHQLKGQLNWPSVGKLVTHFGAARGDMGKKWSGVVIGTSRGSPVSAIARGRVAFSDWLRGYGLLIIIDHGDDYMSLYGYNESLYKDTGEWVEAGEVIANVGDSGGQVRTGLYFEIRKKGNPVNPVKWCAKSKPPAAG